MRLVLKPNAFDKLITNDLLEIKLMDKNVCIKKDMYIGFESAQILQKLITWILSQSLKQMHSDKVVRKLSVNEVVLTHLFLQIHQFLIFDQCYF